MQESRSGSVYIWPPQLSIHSTSTLFVPRHRKRFGRTLSVIFAMDVEQRRGPQPIHRPRRLDTPSGLYTLKRTVRPCRFKGLPNDRHQLGGQRNSQEQSWLQRARRGSGGAVEIERCSHIAGAKCGIEGKCKGRLLDSFGIRISGAGECGCAKERARTG